MVTVSCIKDGKMFYKAVSDNWWNVYLNRARFENLPIKWVSQVEFQITIKDQVYTITSDKHIDRRY